ncbi:ANR-like protein [Mya arenaria]|uniref:ANR-like protein n=1 Tax=Mya arenaria TaxID=6604 RepID=A0ABY7EMH9_MYAAR|nr:cephalotocin receptor 1-like [Mya arenaria]WAR10304.1 ANR-like protein [Mya arenaria]
MERNSSFVDDVFANNTNSSNNSTVNFARNENLATVEIIVQSIIFVLAVLGNGTVILSLFVRKRKLNRMHLLMVHLSVADLFVAVGSVLPQLAWDITFVFKGGDVLCRLVKYMQIVAIYASSYVLVMTAIDRYVAICYPFMSRKWTSRTVHKLVVVAWTLSLLFSVPQLFIFSYRTTSYGTMDCWAMFDPEWTLTFYITIFTVLVYIAPTVILVFCYGSICMEVWRSSRIGVHLARLSQRIRSPKSNGMVETRISKSNSDAVSINTANQTARISKRNSAVNCREECSFEAKDSCKNKLSTKVHFNKDTCSGKKKSSPQKGSRKQLSSERSGKAQVKFENEDQSPSRRKSSVGISRAKIKTIKMTLTVILCYFLCWSPFFIAQMWAAWDATAPFYGAAYTIILLLASLNSCTNPWIYLFFSDSVSAEIKQCVGRICKKP